MDTYNKQRQMLKKEKRTNDRYDSQRKYRLLGCASKEFSSKTSKYRNSRLLSNQKKSFNNLNSPEVYSQPQLVRPNPRCKNNSKVKYAESMNKFRKEFIKNSYTNYEYADSTHRKAQSKGEKTQPNCVNLDEIDIEQLHYQMVKLHQNVRNMHKEI